MKKSDKSTAIGLALGTLAIILGMLNGGEIKIFWDLASVLITVLGSFFALMVSFPAETLKRMPTILKNAFIDKVVSPEDVIIKFVDLSKKARREGLLSLEDEVANIEDNFLKNGIQMVVDGMEPETIRDIMELDIDETQNRHQSGIGVVKAWSGLAPAFGMIGTLIGLVQMLSKLEDQSQLGKGMAIAIITSLYGAIMSNFILTPLATKLEIKSQQEINRREMMLEGVLAIQSGVNPRIIEDKLKAYITPEQRAKFNSDQAQGSLVMGNE